MIAEHFLEKSRNGGLGLSLSFVSYPRNRTVLCGPDWVPGYVPGVPHLGRHTQRQGGKMSFTILHT